MNEVDRPKYLVIADQLRAKIVGGELAPGDRLPSRPEIMRDYGVSDSVAIRAIRVLIDEGLAVSRSGAGTFVREQPQRRRLTRLFNLRLKTVGSPFKAEVERQGGQADWSYESRTMVAPDDIRRRLELPEATEADDVVRTTYVFRADGKPVQLSTSFEDLEVTRGTPIVMPEDGPVVGVMDRMRSIGVNLDGATELLRPRSGTNDECSALGLPPGSYVVQIERTYYAQGRPVETADIVVSADGHEFLYGERFRESD